MSGLLADEVYRRNVPPGLARDVLSVFALHAHDDGTNAKPGIATVAKKVGCDPRTVKRHVRRWVDAGVLSLTARPRPTNGRGALPNVYALDLAALPLKDVGDSFGVPYVPDDQGDNPDDQGDRAVPGNVHERPLERPYPHTPTAAAVGARSTRTRINPRAAGSNPRANGSNPRAVAETAERDRQADDERRRREDDELLRPAVEACMRAHDPRDGRRYHGNNLCQQCERIRLDEEGQRANGNGPGAAEPALQEASA